MRADQALVARGLAPSRSAARRLIGDGAVFLCARGARRPLARPAAEVGEHDVLELAPSDETRFVSRAGAKLAGALAHTGLAVRGARVLDVGISTGGFADCLLQAGAAQVVGVDVGHGQLHPRLAADARVTLFEGLNARELDAARLGAAMPAGGFDLVVADVSFISLTKVLPAVLPLARPGARAVLLVKPQFELGPQALDARGIVRDPQAEPTLRARLTESLRALGWSTTDFFASPLPGGDGNREYFIAGES